MCGDSGINEQIESKPFYITKGNRIVYLDESDAVSSFKGVKNALLITLALVAAGSALAWCGYQVFLFLKDTATFLPAVMGLSMQRHEHRQALLDDATDKRGWLMVGIVFVLYWIVGAIEVPGDF